jgi:hypothetical protein
VKAGPQFEVLAENALGDYCLSSPAISDGQIFIRNGSKSLSAFGKARQTGAGGARKRFSSPCSEDHNKPTN